MQAQLWTVSGLAVELGRDRRTIAKQLEGLAPDEEETRRGGAVTRRWLLARVIVLANEVPTFRDAASALPSRFVILKMTRSFLGREALPGQLVFFSEFAAMYLCVFAEVLWGEDPRLAPLPLDLSAELYCARYFRPSTSFMS